MSISKDIAYSQVYMNTFSNLNISIEIHRQLIHTGSKSSSKRHFLSLWKLCFRKKYQQKNNKKREWLSIEENFQKIYMKSKNSWKKMKCSRGSFSLESKWKTTTEKRGSDALQTERDSRCENTRYDTGQGQVRGQKTESRWETTLKIINHTHMPLP